MTVENDAANCCTENSIWRLSAFLIVYETKWLSFGKGFRPKTTWVSQPTALSTGAVVAKATVQ